MTLFVETDISSFDLRQVLAEISPQRREKALRFRHERGQRECVLAYLLLKKGLRELYGIDENPELLELDGGKPVLKDHTDIHFNLSHCKEAVVCAIGDEPVGVDVEAIRPYKEPLARHVMNDEELLYVTSGHPEFRISGHSDIRNPGYPDIRVPGNPGSRTSEIPEPRTSEAEISRRFTELWTKKEALLKLTGHGIREDLKTILPNDKVKFETIIRERFICTIATYNN